MKGNKSYPTLDRVIFLSTKFGPHQGKGKQGKGVKAERQKETCECERKHNRGNRETIIFSSTFNIVSTSWYLVFQSYLKYTPDCVITAYSHSIIIIYEDIDQE